MRPPDRAPALCNTIPAFFAQAAGDIGCQIPSGLPCDSIAVQGTDSSCFIATAPASSISGQCTVVAVVGGTLAERDLFAKAIEHLAQSSDIKLPRLKITRIEGASFILSPWTFRAEVRTLAAAASEHAKALSSMSTRSDSQLNLQCLSVPSALDDIRPNNTSTPALRSAVHQFLQAGESKWATFMRRATGRRSASRWRFPKGCVVEELVNRHGTCWEMRFDDLETTERACALVEARVDAGKASRLRIDCFATHFHGIETVLPSICLLNPGSAQGGRYQMAKLIQSVLTSLDRIEFTGPTDIACLPGRLQ